MLFTIRTPTSEAESLTLTEANGIELVLNERFLPYRPITLGGKQRAEFTWYPGSPEATVQMLGPEEDTIQLRGFWKDRFLKFGQSAYTTPTATNTANFSALTRIESVADLVQVVDNMRRMGRQIKLSWSGLTRVGHIVSFRHTWHNIHDCEWEIDFAVLSQGEQTVPSVGAVQITLPDAYEVALKAALELQDRIIAKSGLPELLAITRPINTALLIKQMQFRTVANALLGISSGYVNGFVSTSQNVRRTVAVFTGALTQAKQAVRDITDRASTEVFSWAAFGTQDNAPLGTQLSAEYYKRQLGAGFKNDQYNYAVTRNQAATQAAALEAQVQVYTAPQNLDLRDVSTRFYNTPNYWRSLMQYNNLTSSRLTAGQRINVPPVSTFSSATGNL